MSVFDAGDAWVALFSILRERGYDQVQRRYVLRDWAANEQVQVIANKVEEAVLGGGRLQPPLNDLAQKPESVGADSNVFAALLGIDRALLQAHPATSGAAGPLAETRERFVEHLRLNRQGAQGALLPRRSYPGRPSGASERLDEHLHHTLVSAADTTASTFVRVTALQDFVTLPAVEETSDPVDAEEGAPEINLRVASIPFLGSKDDLHLNLVDVAGVPHYTGKLDKDIDWPKRIANALAALDGSGAHIGLLPELTLDDQLLQIWIEAVKSTPRPPDSSLTWLLIGTGPLTCEPCPPEAAAELEPAVLPVNRAVLLDRSRGKIIVTQDKRFPFALADSQVKAWPPALVLGNGPVEEGIRSGARLVFAESNVGRFVIPICEDLGRGVSDNLVRAGSASHALSPIYSPGFSTDDHWAPKRAAELATFAGCDVAAFTSHGVWPTFQDGSPAQVLAVVTTPARTPGQPVADYPTVKRSPIEPPHNYVALSNGLMRWGNNS